MVNGMFVDLKADLKKSHQLALLSVINDYMDNLEILAISKKMGDKLCSTFEYFLKNPVDSLEELNDVEFVILLTSGDLIKVKFIVKPEHKDCQSEEENDHYVFGYDLVK